MNDLNFRHNEVNIVFKNLICQSLMVRSLFRGPICIPMDGINGWRLAWPSIPRSQYRMGWECDKKNPLFLLMKKKIFMSVTSQRHNIMPLMVKM